MVKHTLRNRRQQPKNCLSVFGHFVGLVYEGLKPSNIFDALKSFAKIFSRYRDCEGFYASLYSASKNDITQSTFICSTSVWKHQNNVWNLFRNNNKEIRTSCCCCLYCELWAVNVARKRKPGPYQSFMMVLPSRHYLLKVNNRNSRTR